MLSFIYTIEHTKWKLLYIQNNGQWYFKRKVAPFWRNLWRFQCAGEYGVVFDISVKDYCPKKYPFVTSKLKDTKQKW